MEGDEPKTEEQQISAEPEKKSGGVKKILLIIGGVILLLVVLGSLGGNKGQKGEVSGTQESKATPTPIPMQVSAKQVADDFDSNQVAAENKWNGKLVEFSSKISNITDSGISFSDVASKQFSLTQISCQVTDKQQLMPLKNGQTITVQGIVGKQMLGIIDLSNCVVLK